MTTFMDVLCMPSVQSLYSHSSSSRSIGLLSFRCEPVLVTCGPHTRESEPEKKDRTVQAQPSAQYFEPERAASTLGETL